MKTLNMTTLYYLSLAKNNLSGELPPAMGNLSALQELRLHQNQPVALPESFDPLTALQGLSLHQNQLTALLENFDQLTAPS